MLETIVIFRTVPWEKNIEANAMMQTAAALFGLAALGGLLMAGMRLKGILHPPAVGAVLMAGSTVVMAINARMLRLKKGHTAEKRDQKTVTPLTEKEAWP